MILLFSVEQHISKKYLKKTNFTSTVLRSHELNKRKKEDFVDAAYLITCDEFLVIKRSNNHIFILENHV